jgi:hypothetical protein
LSAEGESGRPKILLEFIFKVPDILRHTPEREGEETLPL